MPTGDCRVPASPDCRAAKLDLCTGAGWEEGCDEGRDEGKGACEGECDGEGWGTSRFWDEKWPWRHPKLTFFLLVHLYKHDKADLLSYF